MPPKRNLPTPSAPSASAPTRTAPKIDVSTNTNKDNRNGPQLLAPQRLVPGPVTLQRPSTVMGPPQPLLPAQGKSDIQMKFEEICFKSPLPRSITQIYNTLQSNSLNSQPTPCLPPPSQRSHTSFLNSAQPQTVNQPSDSLIQRVTPTITTTQAQQPTDYWDSRTQPLQDNDSVIDKTMPRVKKTSVGANMLAKADAGPGRTGTAHKYYSTGALEISPRADTVINQSEAQLQALEGILQSGRKSTFLVPASTISTTNSTTNTHTNGKMFPTPRTKVNSSSILPPNPSVKSTSSPEKKKVNKKHEEDRRGMANEKVIGQDIMGFGWSGTSRRRLSRPGPKTQTAAETGSAVAATAVRVTEQERIKVHKNRERHAQCEDIGDRERREHGTKEEQEDVVVKKESKLTKARVALFEPIPPQVPKETEGPEPDKSEAEEGEKEEEEEEEEGEEEGEEEEEEEEEEQEKVRNQKQKEQQQVEEVVAPKLHQGSTKAITGKYSTPISNSQQSIRRTHSSLSNINSIIKAHDPVTRDRNKSPLPVWVKDVQKRRTKTTPSLQLQEKGSIGTNTTPARPPPKLTVKSEPSKITNSKSGSGAGRETPVEGRRSSRRVTITPREWWVVGAVSSVSVIPVPKIEVEKGSKGGKGGKGKARETLGGEAASRRSNQSKKRKNWIGRDGKEEEGDRCKKMNQSPSIGISGINTGNAMEVMEDSQRLTVPNTLPKNLQSRSLSRGRTTIRGTRRKPYDSPSPALTRKTPPPRPPSSSPPTTGRATKRVRIPKRKNDADEEVDIGVDVDVDMDVDMNVEDEVEAQLRKEREQQQMKMDTSSGLASPSSIQVRSGKLKRKVKKGLETKNDIRRQELRKAHVGKMPPPPSPWRTRTLRGTGNGGVKTRYEIEHADYEFSD